MRQQVTLGVGAVLQFVETVLPVESDARRDDVAFFSGLDRGLQQGVEAELAVIAQDGRPGIDGARNGDGVGRGQRDRMQLALEIPFGCRGHRRAARAVVGHDLALALGLNQREAIAADPRRLRLDHSEQRAGRDRRVGGGAAGSQHLDRRQRRQRMRRRHHGVPCVDRGPAGEMEIPHAKLLTLCRSVDCPLQARVYMAYSWGDGQWLGTHGALAVVPERRDP